MKKEMKAVVRVGPMTPGELRLINSLTPGERKEALLITAKQKIAAECDLDIDAARIEAKLREVDVISGL